MSGNLTKSLECFYFLGLAYDLPNQTWIIEHRHEKYPKPLVQRRHRRDLYNRLEIAIDRCALVFV